jgi:polar amino acid transport system substrate-binding protein
MKSAFHLALTLGAALAASAAWAGETLDRVTQNGAMVVATNSGWPPQSFLSDEGELIGFDIDVAKEIANRLGVEVSFETPDWAIMTGGRWNGRFDLGVGSVTPTTPRAQVSISRRPTTTAPMSSWCIRTAPWTAVTTSTAR